jgi:hypothetical protein
MGELIAARFTGDDDSCPRPSGETVIRRSAPSPTLVATGRREVPAAARALMLAALVCVFIPLFVFADESHWLPRLVEGGHLSLIPGPAGQSSQTHPARPRLAGNGRRDDAASPGGAPTGSGPGGAVVGRRASGRGSIGLSSFVIHTARHGSASSPGAHGSAADVAPVTGSTHLDQPASSVPESAPSRAVTRSTNASPDPDAHTVVSAGAESAVVAASVQATAANADVTALTETATAVSADATVAGQTAAVDLPSGSSPAAPIGGLP